MKRKQPTQGRAVIFLLAEKERNFITWCKRMFEKSKKFYDKLNYLMPDIKNPLVKEERDKLYLSRIIKKANNARKKKRGLIDEIERQQALNEAHYFQLHMKEQKCKYVPSAHRDIAFNANLVSTFGAGQE